MKTKIQSINALLIAAAVVFLSGCATTDKIGYVQVDCINGFLSASTCAATVFNKPVEHKDPEMLITRQQIVTERAGVYYLTHAAEELARDASGIWAADLIKEGLKGSGDRTNNNNNINASGGQGGAGGIAVNKTSTKVKTGNVSTTAKGGSSLATGGVSSNTLTNNATALGGTSVSGAYAEGGKATSKANGGNAANFNNNNIDNSSASVSNSDSNSSSTSRANANNDVDVNNANTNINANVNQQEANLNAVQNNDQAVNQETNVPVDNGNTGGDHSDNGNHNGNGDHDDNGNHNGDDHSDNGNHNGDDHSNNGNDGNDHDDNGWHGENPDRQND